MVKETVQCITTPIYHVTLFYCLHSTFYYLKLSFISFSFCLPALRHSKSRSLICAQCTVLARRRCSANTYWMNWCCINRNLCLPPSLALSFPSSLPLPSSFLPSFHPSIHPSILPFFVFLYCPHLSWCLPQAICISLLEIDFIDFSRNKEMLYIFAQFLGALRLNLATVQLADSGFCLVRKCCSSSCRLPYLFSLSHLPSSCSRWLLRSSYMSCKNCPKVWATHLTREVRTSGLGPGLTVHLVPGTASQWSLPFGFCSSEAFCSPLSPSNAQ